MVITELWDKMGQSKEQQKELFEKSANKLPVGFVATPEDVSRAALHRVPVWANIGMSRSPKRTCTA